MKNDNIQSIEKFLKNASQYLVLHESSPSNPKLEHYFISVTFLDIKDDLLNKFIIDYKNQYPLLDISEASKNYIDKKQENYHFLFIDTLDKNDRFFSQKDNFLRGNIDNILSLRMLGKVVDPSKYIDDQAKKYFSQISDISQSVADVIQREIKSTINTSLKTINDKAPLFKEKMEVLKKIIKPK
jgi:hypothetical protein